MDVADVRCCARSKGIRNGIIALAFSPDGRWLASSSLDKTIKLWDVATGQEMHTLKGHLNKISTLAFSPDGNLWQVAARIRRSSFGIPQPAVEIRTLTGQPEGINAMALSPDALHWHLENHCALECGKPAKREPQPSRMKAWSLAVAFSPDGKQLMSGGFHKTIHAWDVASGAELRALAGHTDTITSLAFTPQDVGQPAASMRTSSSDALLGIILPP